MSCALKNSKFYRKNINYLFLGIALCLFPVVQAKAQDTTLNWRSMKKAQQLARLTNKKILIFAEEDWNIYCKRMRSQVFSDPSVIDSIEKYFYPVRLDISSRKPIRFNNKKTTGKKLANQYHIQAMPTTIFLDSQGNKLAIQPGFISAKKFRRLLGYIGSEAFQTMNFRAYLKNHVNLAANQE